MAEVNNGDPIVDIQGAYAKADNFFQSNKNLIYGAIGAVVLIVGGVLGYNYYQSSQNEEAKELIWKADYYFENDSLDLAIKGSGSYPGYESIASNYSGTKTGKIAEYCLGCCYMKKGEFAKAIEHFENCNIAGEQIGAMALGQIGDANVELGKVDEAITYFEKAVSHSDNSFTCPMFLQKAGLAYENQKNFDKALEAYNRIKTDFPASVEAREIDKYIGRVEAQKK